MKHLSHALKHLSGGIGACLTNSPAVRLARPRLWKRNRAMGGQSPLWATDQPGSFRGSSAPMMMRRSLAS